MLIFIFHSLEALLRHTISPLYFEVYYYLYRNQKQQAKSSSYRHSFYVYKFAISIGRAVVRIV